MQLMVNGAATAHSDASTVTELLRAMGLAERRVAVEVNGAIVPRSQHDSHRLQDGDRIEVVQALGGG